MISQISQKSLDEFKSLYRKQFGKDLTDVEAREKGSQLIRFLEIVYKPMTKEEFDKLEERRTCKTL